MKEKFRIKSKPELRFIQKAHQFQSRVTDRLVPAIRWNRQRAGHLRRRRHWGGWGDGSRTLSEGTRSHLNDPLTLPLGFSPTGTNRHLWCGASIRVVIDRSKFSFCFSLQQDHFTTWPFNHLTLFAWNENSFPLSGSYVQRIKTMDENIINIFHLKKSSTSFECVPSSSQHNCKWSFLFFGFPSRFLPQLVNLIEFFYLFAHWPFWPFSLFSILSECE